MSSRITDRSAARAARLAAAVQASATPQAPAVTKEATPQEAQPKKATRTTKKTTTKKTTAKESRGTRPGGPPAGTAWLPTYLPRELVSDMRDAYMWQLDHTDAPETSLARWVSAAILEHCNRTPQQRAELAEARPAAQVAGTKGHIVRPYTVTNEALAALDDAEVADRTAHIATTSNAVVATAVWARVEATRTAAGGRLPHFTGRLPSKPNPARS